MLNNSGFGLRLSLNVEQFLLGGISLPTFSLSRQIAIKEQAKKSVKSRHPCNP